MIFGEAVRAAETSEPAAWLDEACRGRWWTVGCLVPGHVESHLRIDAPDPEIEDWWSAYRDLFVVVADVGARHTSTPEHAWFGIWEGHGFGNATITPYWATAPADEAERIARDAERRRLRADSERRNASIRSELAAVPRIHRPHRSYHLVTGAVTAVAALRWPGTDDWLRPDLFWPDDRSWFVATDVDFWSLYVGGSQQLTAALAQAVPTPTERVDLDDELVIED